MVELRSFQMFLILMIPFTAAVTQHGPFVTVRVGGEATLPCKDIKDYQDQCFSTTWIFSDPPNRPAVTLFEEGQVHREAASKSDRLSVTEECSLVIKKVTDEDAGRYNCRQFDGGQKVTDSQVELSVNKRDNGAKAPPPPKTTKLPTPPTKGTEATKATTEPTTTKLPTTPTKRAIKATTRPTTTKSAIKISTTTAAPAAAETNPNSDLPAILISVGVVSAALLIIIVGVIRWKRAKVNHTQLDGNTADPPDGVSYASIRYKKTTKSKARVQGGDDMVTYSTLNTSSTSAGASTDPRNLYASINKTKAYEVTV